VLVEVPFLTEIASALSGATPAWLWLAVGAFVGVIVSAACAWRAGIGACGGHVDRTGAAARYSVGAAVNGVAPAGAGGFVRIGLYSRLLPEPDRVLTATGIATAIGAARAPGLALLVVAAALLFEFPLWPVLLLAGAALAAFSVVLALRRRRLESHIGHLLAGFRTLGRAPALAGWVTAATACRVCAAAAVAVALGAPATAAFVIVPAMALASIVPTPGNVGAATGAVGVGLGLSGVDGSTAVAVAIAFPALETLTSLVCGTAGLVYLTRLPAWSVRLAGSAACLALAAAFGVTVLA
jgi:uncharacterized membrane protein YbhN (UPF0104 family)